MTLEEALKLPRVAIAGGPHTGKTTLAALVTDGRFALHTDPDELPADIKAKLDALPEREKWSALSAAVVERLNGEQSFVVEGVRVAHALRKGLKVDAVIWCTRVHPKPGHPRRPKHEETAQGIAKVFRDWLDMKTGTPVIQA